MTELRLLLPIAWAIVSTVIGLVLYKSSAALFEERSQREGRVRKIRLVGSIVIAALAFLGLRESTPREMLTGLPSDSALVSIKDIRAVQDAVSEARTAANELAGCATVSPASQCTSQLDKLKSFLESTESRASELAPR